jgi:hypothetical protein
MGRRLMKIPSPTMNIWGEAAVISGSAALLLVGYPHRRTRQAEARAAAAEATVEQLRS